MGYIGGGGTIMGANPLSAVGGYLPGAAGSALNTGLATGVIGAGVGKLGGMSTQDALKMGLTSGLSAAAMQGLQNMRADQAVRDAQFRSQLSGQDAGGTAQDMLASQSASPTQSGPIGNAQDLLASQSAPGGSMPADYQAEFYKDIGIDPRTMSPTSVGPSPTNIQIERGSLGMTGFGDTARQFMKEPLNVAKDIYNTDLSPSRPGLPSDAGILQKYGPLALAGTAAIAATGGMKGEDGEKNPLFDSVRTGRDYIRDNPNQFSGGLDLGYQRPTTPRSPVVTTPSYGTMPVSSPSVAVPGGLTLQPGGVAQPYNMSGMYGVPLIYGPDGQPQRLAKGGSPVPTEFPRKNGPINGPGTGTSDDIPAMLSDGEFVFTAKAVRNAGNGSRRKGAARMYKLMKMLEGGPVKGK